jgi:hypothetical protein
MSGLESMVAFSDKRVNELAFSKEATHIIIASLVKNKLEVLEDLKSEANYDTKIVLRYGNGLKSIFNYPLDADLSGDWVQSHVSQNEHIYDTMILQKSLQLKEV